MIRDIEKRNARRESIDPDDTYVRSRTEDRSWLIRSAYTIEKYKIFVWLAGVVAVALGFGFRTPAAALQELSLKIDSTKANLQVQIDTLRVRGDRRYMESYQDRMEMRSMIQFIARMKCAELSDKEIARLGGVDACNAAIRPTATAKPITP